MSAGWRKPTPRVYGATIAPALGGEALYEPLACGPYIEAAYRAAWSRAG